MGFIVGKSFYILTGDYYLPNLTLPEELKAKDQTEWDRRMENIHARAREVVLNDLICS